MRRISLLPVSLGILGAALVLALGFNLLMPQGIGLLPEEIAAPLWKQVDLAGAKALLDRGALMVDARPPGDYKQSRVRGAVNLPLQESAALWPLLKETLTAAPKIVVYGRGLSSYPGAAVGQFLKKKGTSEVWVMSASFERWKAAGYPVRERRRRGNP